MHNYKNLKIWKKSMDLTEMIYKETSEFPLDEKYGLTNQIRRASSSIHQILLKDPEDKVKRNSSTFYPYH